MTDFLRLITSMPQDPNWRAPSAQSVQQTAQRQADLARQSEPRSIQLPEDGPTRVADGNREQFPADQNQFFEGWLTDYIQHENSTPAGIGQHQQAMAVTYLMSFDAIQTGDAALLSRRLHQFNEEITRYLRDVGQANFDPANRSAELYSSILQPSMALSQALAGSPLISDANVQAEIAVITRHLREGYDAISQAIPADNAELSFMREFALAQTELIDLHSQNPAPTDAQHLAQNRSILNHLNRALELAGAAHLDENSPLSGYPAAVQNRARTQQEGIQIPSSTDLARSVITGNSLFIVTTIGSEIDLSHRESESVVTARYFRLNQAVASLMALNPRMNLRDLLNNLRNLRWNEFIYDRIVESGISVADAVEIFAGRRQDADLRNRLNGIIRRPGEPRLTDEQVVAALQGTPVLRQIVPILLNNLISTIDQVPATDPSRRWLVEYFRPAERPININMLAQQIAAAYQTQTPLTDDVRNILVQRTGEEGQRMVRNFIRDRQREGEQTGHAPQIPDWLTQLSNAHFETRHEDPAGLVRAQLVLLRQRLSNGERIREGEDDTYNSVVNLITNSRDQDAAHFNELLTDRSLLDEDQRVLTQLLDLDAQAVDTSASQTDTTTPQTYVNRWAQRVLTLVDNHAGSYWEAFLHDNENHPASYRVLCNLFGGRNAGSLNAQLVALTGNGIDETIFGRASQISGDNESTLRQVGQGMASWENIASMGLMVGGTQATTRALMETEMVSSGARVTLADLPVVGRPVRWIVANPVTSSMGVSTSVGLMYAIHNQDVAASEHHESNFGGDFMTAAGVTMAVTSPLWLPAWGRNLQQFPERMRYLAGVATEENRVISPVINPFQLSRENPYNPYLISLVAGGGYAGIHRATNRDSNFARDWALVSGGALAVSMGGYGVVTQDPLLNPLQFRFSTPIRSFFQNPYMLSFGAGGGYAGIHHLINHNSNVGNDWLYASEATFALQMGAYSWASSGTRDSAYRALAYSVENPAVLPLTVGTGYAGIHAITNRVNNRPNTFGSVARDFLVPASITLGFLSPRYLTQIPRIGAPLGNAATWVDGQISNFGVFAEGGQLGFAGHATVSTATGLGTSVLASSLQAGRDSAGGYQTHFGHDMATGTISLGTGLLASTVLGSFSNRLIMRRYSGQLARAIQAGEDFTLTQSSGREALGMTGRTLLSATIATGGMVIGTTISQALTNGHVIPHRDDWHVAPAELTLTFLNMLAFEGINGGINRLSLRSTLGRVRATQVDHIVDRLMQGVTLPSGENPATLRNFLWNRLALEAARGVDLTALSTPEALRNWQVNFRQVQLNGVPAEAGSTGTAAPEGRLGSAAARLRARLRGPSQGVTSPLGVDNTPLGNLPADARNPQGAYHIDLSRRATPLPADAGLTAAVQSLVNQAIPRMVRESGRSLPSVEVFVTPTGEILAQRPAGAEGEQAIPVTIEFSGNQVYLPPRTRRAVQRHVTDPARQEAVLGLHGQPVAVPTIVTAFNQAMRNILTNRSRHQDVSLILVRTQTGHTPTAEERASGRLIYHDGDYEIWTGPVETLTAGRRGHVLGEVYIPARRSEGNPRREPTVRVRQGSGQIGDLPQDLRTMLQGLRLARGISPILQVTMDSNIHPWGDVPQVFPSDSITLRADSFQANSSIRRRIPDDLRLSITRDADGQWWLVNESSTSAVTMVSQAPQGAGGQTQQATQPRSSTLRQHQRARIGEQGVDVTIPSANSGSEPVTLRVRLPQSDAGANDVGLGHPMRGGNGPTPLGDTSAVRLPGAGSQTQGGAADEGEPTVRQPIPPTPSPQAGGGAQPRNPDDTDPQLRPPGPAGSGGPGGGGQSGGVPPNPAPQTPPPQAGGAQQAAPVAPRSVVVDGRPCTLETVAPAQTGGAWTYMLSETTPGTGLDAILQHGRIESPRALTDAEIDAYFGNGTIPSGIPELFVAVTGPIGDQSLPATPLTQFFVRTTVGIGNSGLARGSRAVILEIPTDMGDGAVANLSRNENGTYTLTSYRDNLVEFAHIADGPAASQRLPNGQTAQLGTRDSFTIQGRRFVVGEHGELLTSNVMSGRMGVEEIIRPQRPPSNPPPGGPQNPPVETAPSASHRQGNAEGVGDEIPDMTDILAEDLVDDPDPTPVEPVGVFPVLRPLFLRNEQEQYLWLSPAVPNATVPSGGLLVRAGSLQDSLLQMRANAPGRFSIFNPSPDRPLLVSFIHAGDGQPTGQLLTLTRAQAEGLRIVEPGSLQVIPDSLFLLQPHQEARTWNLSFDQNGCCRVGRAEGNPVRVDDQTVSRQHAVIRRDAEGNLTIEPLSTSAGTAVNQDWIYSGQSRRLNLNDMLWVGGIRLQLIRNAQGEYQLVTGDLPVSRGNLSVPPRRPAQ